MLKHGKAQSTIVVRVFIYLFFVSFFFGCSTNSNPFELAAQNQKDEQERLSLRHTSYRLQKKYDLLEKELLKEYDKCINQNHVFGQLYTALDLADFFTYGFIDYKKSLDYYAKAEELNHLIKNQGYIGDDQTGSITDVEKGEPIVYYEAEGRYVVPRIYHFQEITEQIETGRKRIQRILGESYSEIVPPSYQDEKFPATRTAITEQYGSVILVNKDILAPDIFEEFEIELLKKAREYVKYRYKLSEKEKTYSIHYNVARGLINTFDIFTLSLSQTDRLLKHITTAITLAPNEEFNPQTTYLTFGRILCLSRIGKHQDVINYLDQFQAEIATIQETVTAYLEDFKTSRRSAIAGGIAYIAVSATINLVTAGLSGNPVGIISAIDQSISASLAMYNDPISLIQREITFIGESEYAKNLNIILNMDEQLQLFRALGRSYHQLGNIERSTFYNKEAIKIITNLRSTVASEKNRISFARYKDAVYNTLIDDLIAENNSQEALFYAESSRSRALVDLLGSRKDIVFKDGKTNNYIREQRNAQIYRDALRKETSTSDEQAKYINELHASLAGETDVTQELLSLITVSELQIPEIQKLLPQKASLVEYYLSDHHIYAWVLDRENVSSYLLEMTPDQLRSDVQEMHTLIVKTRAQRGGVVQFGENTETRSELKRMDEISQELYNALFAPLEAAIHDNQVYIICHRDIHALSFEMLHDGHQFLVEKYAIAYLPNASLLQFLKPTNGKFQSILALGNPDIEYRDDLSSLTWAEQEAAVITELFPQKSIYTKHQATETVFRAEAPHYQVLHVASHGEFEHIDPLNSRIFLTRDPQHDGMLTAKDLYGLQLNASLVTLSACETGMSEVETGDELLGLIRGFLFAGTSNLIASLWKVDDIATQKLMLQFYTHLVSENMPIAQALQQAKIDMIHREEYAHPFYWAPFNLYGIGL